MQTVDFNKNCTFAQSCLNPSWGSKDMAQELHLDLTPCQLLEENRQNFNWIGWGTVSSGLFDSFLQAIPKVLGSNEAEGP